MMRKLVLPSLLAVGALAFAHHVPVALSYVAGPEILTEIVVVLRPGALGVPAYLLSEEEPGHTVTLQDGSGFFVTDASGATEAVKFRASDFADIGAATLDEIVATLNAQLSIAQAREDNSYLVLHGTTGGVASTLGLQNGPGSPLGDLHLTNGIVSGSQDVELVLSVPHDDDDHGVALDHAGLAGHPYFLFASATEGTVTLAGADVPLVPDAVTNVFLRGMFTGVFPGFYGNLDGGADATAVLPTSILPPGNSPEALYFAYVVLSEDFTEIEMVSNRFTVRIVD